MAFQFDPTESVTANVRRLGARQIDLALKRLSAGSKQARAVHETRKATKRLRALLHLVKPALAEDDFKRESARLKRIARSLSGVRDIQAMLECIAKLEAASPDAAQHPVGQALHGYLKAKRKDAESRMQNGADRMLHKQLGAARRTFKSLELDDAGFGMMADTIRRDYRNARRAFRSAYESGEDEDFHEWRKYVQRHWRQLLLIEPGWPAALRPQIMLVRDLSETLGDDHDLFVLAGHIREAGRELAPQDDVETYLAMCRKRQDALRVSARLMGERLFSERPSSFAARIAAYWRTQPELETMPQRNGA